MRLFKNMSKTIILKLSGESLSDIEDGLILNNEKMDQIISIINTFVNKKYKVGIVIGAGNIFRGRIANKIGVNQESGDYMGMLGTMINCIALGNLLTKNNIKNQVFSALPLSIERYVLPYDVSLANNLLNEGYVLLFGAGVGKPNFTTDTCAAKRAIEVNADLILCGKNGVDGVYSDDPKINKSATLISKMSYNDIISNNLKVIDKTAAELLKDSKVVTKIFSMDDISNFIKVIDDENIGTTIKGDI